MRDASYSRPRVLTEFIQFRRDSLRRWLIEESAPRGNVLCSDWHE